jgi:hypothetical protein
MKFLSGIVVGIVIATIGVQGVARIAEKGVTAIQQAARQANSN